MSLDDVDERRFNNDEAALAAGTGVSKSPQMPEFQQVVSEVIFAYGWPNILRGCLRGEVVLVFWTQKGAFLR